jgi:cohesin complex subunit SA-1/2
VLDGIAKDEAHTIALSKLVVSCFIIRGAQLSIVRRLDAAFVVQVQLDLLTWIGSRLAMYENNRNAKSRKAAINFFKALLPLLTVSSDDAPKMYASLVCFKSGC